MYTHTHTYMKHVFTKHFKKRFKKNLPDFPFWAVVAH